MPSVDRETPRSRAGALPLAVVTALILGCVAAPPPPAFVRAAAPGPDSARLYVYRADPRHSLSTIRLSLDGRPLGAMRDGEYATWELRPGRYELRAALRGWGLAAWGWNTKPLQVSAGEVAFIRLSVRLSERPLPGRALEIAGRPGGAASENVYFERRRPTEAWAELAATVRAQPEP